MSNTFKITEDLFWVGALDPNLKIFDIIMETKFGTSYNSYLLRGSEGIALFETVKEKFFDEHLEKIRSVINLEDINYVVVNHTEPDHAGSVEKILEYAPNATVVGSNLAIKYLTEIINKPFKNKVVKDGEKLSLGNKTLKFISATQLHWPDTMYTYVIEDETLITCDSFGAHYCDERVLKSAIEDSKEDDYIEAYNYNFRMIVGPFKPFVLKALDKIKDLDIDMICTGHGPVLDCRLDEIKETYKTWSTVVNPNPRKTVIIPYVSAYGYTKELALEIEKGIKDSGDIDVRAYDLVESDRQKVLEEIGFADGILFGTPTIVGEALKPIWDLTTSIFATTHGKKLASAFGSYGWSGEGVPHIIERLKQLKMDVVDGFRVKFKPSEKDLKDAYEYGFNFGHLLINKENKK